MLFFGVCGSTALSWASSISGLKYSLVRGYSYIFSIVCCCGASSSSSIGCASSAASSPLNSLSCCSSYSFHASFTSHASFPLFSNTASSFSFASRASRSLRALSAASSSSASFARYSVSLRRASSSEFSLDNLEFSSATVSACAVASSFSFYRSETSDSREFFWSVVLCNKPSVSSSFFSTLAR